MDIHLDYLNKSQFDKVIELNKDNKDSKSIYYLLLAYIGNNDIKKAQGVIDSNRSELFKYNPKGVIKADIVLSLSEADFISARDKLEIYENFPYVSQEIEELFKFYKEKIKEEEKSLLKSIKKNINGKEENKTPSLNEKKEIIYAYLLSLPNENRLNKVDLDFCLDLIASNRELALKKYALLILTFFKVDKEINFDNKVYNPKDLTIPTLDKNYLNIKNKLASIADLSLPSICTSLLDSLSYSLFPERIEDDEKFFDSLLCLGKKYLGLELDKHELEKASRLDLILKNSPSI